MRCSQKMIFEIFSDWREAKVPLQFHYGRQTDSINISRGFITACSQERVAFTPMCPESTQCDPIVFDISSTEGDYTERSSRSGDVQSGKSKGGVLRLPTADGVLLFVELDGTDL
jgi:hypothetical protein